MQKSKYIIKILRWLFRWAFYLNIVLAGGAIGFQIINLIIPSKNLTIAYLGKFTMKVENVGVLKLDNGQVVPLIIKDIQGDPTFYASGKVHLLFVLTYTTLIALMILYTNFHLMGLFQSLHQSLTEGQPFNASIPKRLKWMAWGFGSYFIISMIFSLCKYMFLHEMMVGSEVLKPVYDNEMLNYLWLTIGFLILAEVFQAGLILKQENDLTI